MKSYWLLPLTYVLISSVHAQSGLAPPAVTELDFLSDMPIVLSVSRLAQRLDETPGAVTLLDREFIRQSGARDVIDLLRLVPGFQTASSFETDAPMATYHGRTDDWANRIQVLVDGRSVYAGHLQGSAGLGWQTLALDDIERIEVLRGSNSATYGARAFLGVVNIVSRDVRETVGLAAKMTAGENGVRDMGLHAGWGDSGATFRISADKREDNGLRNAFGRSEMGRINASSHVILSRESELTLRVGALDIDAGRGTPGDAGNNARTRYLGSRFIQADWHKTLDENRDLSVSASRTEHKFRDNFPLLTTAYDEAFGAPYSNTLIDFSGSERNDAVSLQYTARQSEAVRYVVGTELRRESVTSKSSFDEAGGVVTNFLRLFGNLEWRFAPAWILNAGAMAEQIGNSGNNGSRDNSVSPRLMLNWQMSGGQTLRAGVSTAIRPPSAYEKYADVKYYDRNGQNPLTWIIHDGALTPERVVVKELGYYAKLPQFALSADVRLFQESISNGIAHNRSDPPSKPEIYRNTESSTIDGIEYQAIFQPAAGSRIFWSQTWTNIAVGTSVDPVRRYRAEAGAAPRASSLMLSHTLKPGWEVSAAFNDSDGSTLQSSNIGTSYRLQRTDVRLVHAFRMDKTKVEVALTVQNLGPASLNSDNKFYFDQRAFVTLRIAN